MTTLASSASGTGRFMSIETTSIRISRRCIELSRRTTRARTVSLYGSHFDALMKIGVFADHRRSDDGPAATGTAITRDVPALELVSLLCVHPGWSSKRARRGLITSTLSMRSSTSSLLRTSKSICTQPSSSWRLGMRVISGPFHRASLRRARWVATAPHTVMTVPITVAIRPVKTHHWGNSVMRHPCPRHTLHGLAIGVEECVA